MPLIRLPNELLFNIAYHLDSTKDINALVRTNRRFFRLLLEYLYSYGGQSKTPLLLAAQKGFETLVKLILELKVDVNAKSIFRSNPHYCKTALTAACERGDEKIAQLLLKNGAIVNPKNDCYCRTTLTAACEKGEEKVVQLLLKEGAIIDSKDEKPSNPLCEASNRGHEKIVELLLAAGAEVNLHCASHHSPLHAAIDRGCGQVVKLLLKAGADTNSQAECHGLPLHMAVSYGHKHIVELLLDHGVSVDSNTLLYDAVKYGHTTIVKLLLERGTDPNACAESPEYRSKRPFGYPLQAASYLGHKALVKLLLNAGADPNAQGGIYNNALWAATADGFATLEVVKLLLDAGAIVYPSNPSEQAESREHASQSSHHRKQPTSALQFTPWYKRHKQAIQQLLNVSSIAVHGKYYDEQHQPSVSESSRDMFLKWCHASDFNNSL